VKKAMRVVSKRGRREGQPPNNTGIEAIRRAERVKAIMDLRRRGWTLQRIADVQRPRVSRVAIHKAIVKALNYTEKEEVEAMRQLELLRLDALSKALYERATSGGDLAAVDRMLAIGDRRARLTGLYKHSGEALRIQPAGKGTPAKESSGVRVVRVEIVSVPEAAWKQPPRSDGSGSVASGPAGTLPLVRKPQP
jgi:hypothetical protein